jgi:hypothetical protein
MGNVIYLLILFLSLCVKIRIDIMIDTDTAD